MRWESEPAASIHNAYKLGERDLRHLDLYRVNLGESIEKTSSRRRVVLRDADFSGAILEECRFVGADLRGCNFSGSNLVGANFVRSYADGATFDGATVQFCRFSLADLAGASLDDTYAAGADFWHTDLLGASFRNSTLSGSHFFAARIDGADFAHARLDECTLTDVDLSPLCIGSLRPSALKNLAVDWRSVARSAKVDRDKLKRLLTRSGMPPIVTEYLIDAAGAESDDLLRTLMRSTFISYGGPDEAFARRLRDELRKHDVDTFFFASDAPLGEKLHRVMHDGVNSYDRVILICSEASLQRSGVLNEIEETLAREARDGGVSYLIPIRLDDFLFTNWSPTRRHLVDALRSRVVGDFRGAMRNSAKFSRGMTQLIAALKTKPDPRRRLIS